MPELEAHEVACDDVAELLPVYLNGSLDDESARRLEAHLASCAACRNEERDARTAFALFEGHLPTELLVDYALGLPLPARGAEVVESHLSSCDRCSAELDEIGQEPTEEEPSFDGPRAVAEPRAIGPVPERPVAPETGGLRMLAWAACLAAVVTSVGWLSTWRQLVDERASGATSEARANISVVELLPAAQPLLRSGGGDPGATANRLEMAGSSNEIVLVLLSGGRECQSGCVLEIYEAGAAEPSERLEGLAASPDGHVTLVLPNHWLVADRSILVVRDLATGELGAEYLVETR